MLNEIDVWAWRSPLRNWSWLEKLTVAGGAFWLAYRASTPWICLVLCAGLAGATCWLGRIPWRLWLRQFLGPAGFLGVTAALGAWAGTLSAPQVLGRSLACLSALLWLGLSTPLTTWLGLAMRSRVPLALAETGFWMYRLLGSAQEAWQETECARQLRAGRRPLHTLGLGVVRWEERLAHRTRRWGEAADLRGGTQGLGARPDLGRLHWGRLALILFVYGLLSFCP